MTTDKKIQLQITEALCPKGDSLISDEVKLRNTPSIKVAARIKGRKGTIFLSAFFGDFTFQTSLELNKGDVVELFCAECGQSLSIDEVCRACGATMFAVNLPDGGRVEACPRVGCHNHKLTLVDLDTQFLRFYSNEIMPKM